VQTAAGDAYSAVHISAMAGNAVKCKRLIEASAGRGLTLKDSKGRTPCLAAASMGQTDILKMLHEQFSVALTDCDPAGLTALHWAADGGHTALMRYLLQQGVDVDFVSTGADCDTPLTVAVTADSAAAVQLLLEHGCDVNKLNEDGLTAAYTAANGNFVQALTALSAGRCERLCSNRLHTADAGSSARLSSSCYTAAQQRRCSERH
jgi:ankyrin repeat protein